MKYARNHEIAIIHACKTCHKKELGYHGSLSAEHPHYLVYEKENHLFLNMVDAPVEFLPKFANPMFKEAMNFITAKKILIHCNQGLSRSPSIGMLYLATKNIIPDGDYESAANAFIAIYPDFSPGNGIKQYMKNNWDYLIRLNS